MSESHHPVGVSTIRRGSLTATCFVGWWLVLAAVGCGDPLYDDAAPAASESSLTLASRSDTSHYDWPLTRDNYVVAKPPQMAYVTSFSKTLSRPDPVEAELVPWSEEGLDDAAKRFLRHAYSPRQVSPDVRFTLTADQFDGPNAFDVSIDGKRLIVLHDGGLDLYRTEDGTKLGRMELPAEVAASASSLEAVRFGGKSGGILVAAPEAIFRIDGKDKRVSRTRGCGEPIADWIVNRDDTAMVIRTESGKLFGGDPQLNFFSAYNVGKDMTFDSVGLNADGQRIAVHVGGVPRTYVQDNFQMVDHVDHDRVRLDPNVSISAGAGIEAWVDGDGVYYSQVNSEGRRSTGLYHMMWKPHWISAVENQSGSTFFLTIGTRFFEGNEQLVLFDFGVNSRNNSLPTILDEMPTRVAHDMFGRRLAMLDSDGLHLVHHEVWHAAGPVFVPDWTYGWIDQDKIAVIERVLEIVKSQDRYAFGLSSEEMRSRIIEYMAARWFYLEGNEPESEVLKRLEAWGERGSQLALVVRGVHHQRAAWNARGGGTVDTVSGDGWNVFAQRAEMAAKDLDRAIEMGNPPLVALTNRVDITLEQGGELEDCDSLCRQAMELYPGEVEPHASIAFKLLPRWFGERGDTVSYALSVSKLVSGSDADLLYMRLIGGVVRYILFPDTTGWKSYDSNRIKRGIEEAIRRDIDAETNLWLVFIEVGLRSRDRITADRLLSYLMSTKAAIPAFLDDPRYGMPSPEVHANCERIRGAR